MRVGLNSTGTNHATIEQLVDEACLAGEVGLTSFWVPNYFGMDALSALVVVGMQVPGIALGTAVVPIYTRHHFAMAQQALTVQAALDGRLTLGLGLSHRSIVEGAWRLDYHQPAATMERYLIDLEGLIHPVSATDRRAIVIETGVSPPRVPGVDRVPVVVAALGPRMVEIAGTHADGVVLYCVGPTGLTGLVPRLHAAAARAGRASPRIVVSLPVLVTDDRVAGLALIAKRLANVDELPSYRRSLAIEGATSIADIALVGGRVALADGIGRLVELGVTEFIGMVIADNESQRRRTLDVLGDIARSLG